jgi:hypothetical protein
LLSETLRCAHDAVDTQYLLATAAALKGHRELGLAITDIE